MCHKGVQAMFHIIHVNHCMFVTRHLLLSIIITHRHNGHVVLSYREQMPPTTEHQLTVEKTPSYYVTKLAPGRVRNMTRSESDVRLIVVVRDPVTRAVSDYTQAATKRPGLPPFDRLAFVDRPSASASRRDRPSPVVNTSWGPIKIGLYARHLERWLRYFRSDRIHFVSGERLVSDPSGELARVEQFLGLRPLIAADWFYFNTTKGFPCLLRRPAAAASAADEATASSAAVATTAAVTSSSLRCLGKTKGRIHPTVDADVLRRLHDFYRPYNEKFYRMTGIDFGWP